MTRMYVSARAGDSSHRGRDLLLKGLMALVVELLRVVVQMLLHAHVLYLVVRQKRKTGDWQPSISTGSYRI